MSSSGPGSSVGIATGYGLDGPAIESRWGARFSAPVQTGPGAHPASCTMGTGSLQGVKSGRGVTLTPHPLLVPWSWKGRAIPLLPLWAVRLVQSLSACTRVHFTFYHGFQRTAPWRIQVTGWWIILQTGNWSCRCVVPSYRPITPTCQRITSLCGYSWLRSPRVSNR